jgi:NodT family efflux transporter outer membrane factor (OMF) lipoprotein
MGSPRLPIGPAGRARAAFRPAGGGWGRLWILGGIGAAAGLLAGCAAGPDYVPPAEAVPAKFKESDAKETAARSRKRWKPITPLDLADRGPWWLVFNDPELTKLVPQVRISNQTVAAAAAAYDETQQVIREGQAGLFPTVTASYTAARTRTPVVTTSTSGTSFSSSPSVNYNRPSAAYASTYTAAANASWELDVWGRIRRTVEADAAAAQVSAADLANATLSAQVQLAVAYFNLRASDELEASLKDTLVEFKRTRDILKNQYAIGTSSRADYITADNQVLTTEATATNVGVQRAQYEHAIAMLIGRSPAEFSIPKRRWRTRVPPVVPAVLPSTLLERRPDVAAAERQLQQLNALIGVAVANFYPEVNLSALASFAAPKPWPVTLAYEAWSLMGGVTQTVYDGGLLDAQLQAAKANYRQGVANYRQTVLAAFQQVEDQLAAIRLLLQELKQLDQAVKEAHDAVGFYFNQYRVGTVAFTSVVTAQATLLTNIESQLAARQSLFVATVTLIGALGGGWNASTLPAVGELSAIKAPPPPVPLSALPATFAAPEAH